MNVRPGQGEVEVEVFINTNFVIRVICTEAEHCTAAVKLEEDPGGTSPAV